MKCEDTQLFPPSLLPVPTAEKSLAVMMPRQPQQNLPPCCKRKNTDFVRLLCRSVELDISYLTGLHSHNISSLKMQMKLGYSTFAGWRK